MSSVFGLNEFNQLVHVSEVTRGLACRCRCVQCREPIMARRGPVRGHHFAHASNLEACDSNHETLLHWYAKRLIVEAGVLVTPMTPEVADFLGLAESSGARMLRAMGTVQEEVHLGDIRPDLLVVTDDGIQVAIEVAFSSFCDATKAAAFEFKGLPALEIDLSGFSPEAFDPEAVRRAVIESVLLKRWVWPSAPSVSPFATRSAQVASPPAVAKTYLPEEKISFSGRWVSVRQFPSGDIAVKVVAWDPDLVSLVRSVAKAHGGRFNPQYKTWNIPRWAARTVRAKLNDKAQGLSIGMGPVS
ncbi:hypothetical protein [Hydrogenophaga taeniospiralis]|uniref:hypothetical protein n=1 Tax=Hydrogenophaga taeniospiralis TaxID=65656 RepID=UPI001CFB7011|nr:hypothetical protein [Hydrogenophaga taeniospiralis]UCU95215.1 hypothetical protein KI616_04970 [Hydrogenophaga taeniospiralis]